ncbi:MAG: AtpZ/AtpI family protein [Bacillota bacterium]|nr:AtpZ/AtpI family protein [Bacillota bacterium]
MGLFNKNTMRALAMVTQIGVNMIVPIGGAILLAQVLTPDNPIATMLFILFGVGVAFRNFFQFAIQESRRKTEDKAVRRGRPEGWKGDPDGSDQED